MLPLRDNIPSRTTPLVNYAIIGCCTLVFLMQLGERPGQPSLVERYGMIPARVRDPSARIEIPEQQLVRTLRGVEVRETLRPAAPPAVPVWLTLLTCTFLHGGWMHFLGNMWFLYIFGDNVEDRLGHGKFLLCYVGWGVAASAAHLVTNASSPIPTIGASGAIAGVMGAYFLLYPRAMVLTLVPIFFFLEIVVLPAPLFLGIWFVLQFFQGAFAILTTQATGVAWWAHIGGFAAGAAVVWILGQTHHLRPRVATVLPNTDHVTYYRFRRGNRWE